MLVSLIIIIIIIIIILLLLLLLLLKKDIAVYYGRVCCGLKSKTRTPRMLNCIFMINIPGFKRQIDPEPSQQSQAQTNSP